MPRTGKGASNRTDLPGKAPEAITTVPGQAYGNVTAQRQAQKVLPISAPGVAAGGAPAAPSGPAGPGTPPPTGLPKLPWLDPTTHGLPVTTGRPYGAGAGPQALTGAAAQWHAQQQSESGNLNSLLKGLANTPGASSAVKQLAANAGG
jgi:hypothetical protein